LRCDPQTIPRNNRGRAVFYLFAFRESAPRRYVLARVTNAAELVTGAPKMLRMHSTPNTFAPPVHITVDFTTFLFPFCFNRLLAFTPTTTRFHQIIFRLSVQCAKAPFRKAHGGATRLRYSDMKELPKNVVFKRDIFLRGY
jgi:hypothetical protein